MDLANTFPVILGVSIALVVLTAWRARQQNPRSLPYPPQPPANLLVGNLKDVPKGGNEWLKYEELGRTLGNKPNFCVCPWFLLMSFVGTDVGFLDVLGTPLLFLNSFKAAADLLEKKGSVFSDRPRLVMLKEL
jgi:hypothetical protein